MLPNKINGFVIDWHSGELSTKKQIKTIEPKLLAVLKILVAANGQLVAHEQLHQEVWGEIVVAPNALQRCIAQLRKLLGDNAKSQIVIKTHPKRGYSIVQKVVETEIENEILDKKLNLYQVIFASLVLFSLSALIHFVFIKESFTPPTFSQISSLDTGPGSLRSPLFINNTDNLVFIRNHKGEQALVLRHKIDGTEKILQQGFKYYGNLTLTPDHRAVTYGKTLFKNNNKCAQLEQFTFSTEDVEVLIPCKNAFYHSAVWLDDKNMIINITKKDHSTKLVKFNKQNNKFHKFEFDKVLSLALSPNQQLLAMQYKDKISFMRSDKTFSLVKNIPFSFRGKMDISWFDDSTILVSSQRELLWFNINGDTNTTNILTSKVLSYLTTQNNNLYALLSRKNWNVHLRDYSQYPYVDKSIASSKFNEKSGMFRPGDDSISVLSDRDGKFQIWLKNNTSLTKLTQHPFDIKEYLWLDNGKALVFLSKNKLWRINFRQSAKLIELPYQITSLYQKYENKLIINVIEKNKEQVISLDLDNFEYITLYRGANSWAQKISSEIFLVSDHTGKINKYINGSQVPVTALPPVTIQSKYVLKDSFVYLQDKQQNVWQYDPVTEQAKVLGHFDLNALFMTDFSGKKNQMLTDNFISEVSELVKLH